MVRGERDGSGLALKGLSEDAGLPESQRQPCVWIVVEFCQLAESVRGGIFLRNLKIIAECWAIRAFVL